MNQNKQLKVERTKNEDVLKGGIPRRLVDLFPAASKVTVSRIRRVGHGPNRTLGERDHRRREKGKYLITKMSICILKEMSDFTEINLVTRILKFLFYFSVSSARLILKFNCV